MTHLVFGTGLVGGFIGAGLIDAGIDTIFLGRDTQRDAMQQGLTISSIGELSKTLQAPRFWNNNTNQDFDVIWLTIKCTSVEASIDEIRPLLSQSTIIVCCQNGFASDAPIRAAFPNNIILNAVVGFNVAQQASNHLHRSTDGHLVVESHPCIDNLVSRLNSKILPTHSSHNIEGERWAKLQLNLVNPVNALSNLPVKTMTEDPEYRKVLAALMLELLNVTKAMQITLPKLTLLPARCLPFTLSLPNLVYLRVAQKALAIDPTARVSMWWDLSQSKKSEIDFLNQSVVEQGKRLGIDCKYNKRIVQLIHKVERNEMKLGLSGVELQTLLGIK